MRKDHHSFRCGVAVAVTLLSYTAIPTQAAQPDASLRLYPLQVGSCEQPSADPEIRRILSRKSSEAKPCPMFQPTATSLREDEDYEIKDARLGIMSGSGMINGTLAFAQAEPGDGSPGYIDADITFTVNSATVATESVTAMIAPDQELEVAIKASVPKDLAGKRIGSGRLTIHWKAGTTPWVEPVMDGSSYLILPLQTKEASTADFNMRFTVRTQVSNRSCPPNKVCHEVQGSSRSRPLGGAVSFRRINKLSLQSSEPCPPASTSGTMTLRKGNVRFKGKGEWCRADGSGRYKIRATGGTGSFRGAAGSWTIVVEPLNGPRGGTEVWKGFLW